MTLMEQKTEKFKKVWNRAETSRAAAIRLGISYRAAVMRAWRLRKVGHFLKRHDPRGRTAVSLVAVNLDSDLGPDVQGFLRSKLEKALNAKLRAEHQRIEKEFLYGKPGGKKPRGILSA